MLDLPLPDIPTLVNFIERRTMVLYAGSMAEALNADASDIDGDKALGLLKEIEGLDDFQKHGRFSAFSHPLLTRMAHFWDC